MSVSPNILGVPELLASLPEWDDGYGMSVDEATNYVRDINLFGVPDDALPRDVIRFSRFENNTGFQAAARVGGQAVKPTQLLVEGNTVTPPSTDPDNLLRE